MYGGFSETHSSELKGVELSRTVGTRLDAGPAGLAEVGRFSSSSRLRVAWTTTLRRFGERSGKRRRAFFDSECRSRLIFFGQVYAAGSNYFGQLGTVDRRARQKFSWLSHFVNRTVSAVFAGHHASIALSGKSSFCAFCIHCGALTLSPVRL